jgi:beta-aspartyl-peptidase (threonine type)
MKSTVLRLVTIGVLVGFAPLHATAESTWTLVLHGGAGTILRQDLDTETEAAYRSDLQAALDVGAEILASGGSSLDAVEATIRFLEDSPLFNAGKGAVFTEAGVNEMDASIMDGRDRNAGAVAGVTTVRNPISAARAVMEKSPHVMLAREGAEAFAAAQGLVLEDPAYFRTERRWQAYLEAKAKRDADTADRKHGTVGCVALDQQGNLTAGTSTGGMTLKMWGRIGDAPVIGAGTYADNATCGVSATGHGEYFIRNVVAYDIAALMKYKGLSLQAAAEEVVLGKLVAQQATGGIVALDAAGNVAMVFNTPGMYRGFRDATGETEVAIFGE